MAYTFQGQTIVAPFRLSSNEPVFSADSISLKVRRVKQGAQRWEMGFNVVMTDASSTFADMITTFHDEISLEMPQLNVRGEIISSGTCTDALTSIGVENAGDNTIGIDGMTVGTTINKGRFVKFSNHNKMYLVTETLTSTAGTDLLKIYPSLRNQITSADSLLYRDGVDAITFKAYRDISNTQGITYVDGIISDLGTINLLEAL